MKITIYPTVSPVACGPSLRNLTPFLLDSKGNFVKKEWNFNRKDWDPTVEITFYVDGTEHEFEQELRDDMDSMKLFFDTYGKMVVIFRVVTEDGEIGRWFV